MVVVVVVVMCGARTQNTHAHAARLLTLSEFLGRSAILRNCTRNLVRNSS